MKWGHSYMDLIIKPTNLCNFKCTYCSSNKISKDKAAFLSDEILYKFLDEHDINTIIVNGGDPLMMPPEYYWKLIKYLDDKKAKTDIAFTSNLWDWYMNPDKWNELFHNDRIGICTSFNYGGNRILPDGSPLTEEIFIDIWNKFYNTFGERLTFISVITRQNEKDIWKLIELAKRLNTGIKINPVVVSGKSRVFYPFHRIMNFYLDIILSGDIKYEENSQDVYKIIKYGEISHCPYARDCYKHIRCISPDGLIHSCGAFNDEHYTAIRFHKKTYELSEYNEDQMHKDFFFLKKECLACDLFQLCNSCYKRMKDIYTARIIHEHCDGMKKLKRKINKVKKLNLDTNEFI